MTAAYVIMQGTQSHYQFISSYSKPLGWPPLPLAQDCNGSYSKPLGWPPLPHYGLAMEPHVCVRPCAVLPAVSRVSYLNLLYMRRALALQIVAVA